MQMSWGRSILDVLEESHGGQQSGAGVRAGESSRGRLELWLVGPRRLWLRTGFSSSEDFEQQSNSVARNPVGVNSVCLAMLR